MTIPSFPLHKRHLSTPFSFAVRLLGGLALSTVVFVAGCNGCNSSQSQAPIVDNSGSGPDPAAANLAPASTGQPAAVLGTNASYTPQQQSESYDNGQQQPAPIQQDYNDQSYAYNAPPPSEAGYDENAQYDYSDQAPPPLPDYDQPPAPDPNYLWTPGYWAWGPDGYYWVPGAWVPPPYYGALWTPPYWGWYGGRYCFHHGYWGPHVGFYGGINYGFGYIGIGYFGGYWRGHDFYYNRSVNNVGHLNGSYVYNRAVVYNGRTYGARPNNRVSYNGGRGGLNVRPQAAELAARREPHTAPRQEQIQLRQTAMQNPRQRFSANNGRPAEAFARPGTIPARSIGEAPRQVQQIQQRSAEQRQRNQQLQQHNVQQQQRNTQEQQRNVQGQQRNQQLQQRNVQQQQHTQQVQQRNAQEQQRNVQQRQRVQQGQQRNQQIQQQRVQQEQQQRNQQVQQQRTQQQQQQRVQQQQRMQQERRPAPQTRPAPEARPAPQVRPAPQSRPAPQAARPAPQPHEAPHEEGHPH
ncbi:BcpO-related WXXGXW repeat protein [Granulicella sp. 5B5]|uniref:YXWGXW repeat-containing protein n=1 Tax=Granulicella sp. 5B5 TaxID=1617967 RepID=UPI0015F47589|nr:YXWGXW repeat-containing protein [Granulicella sp. 5B5]QMV18548.1 BcpO-related WXXGXW repeat protein [Granulicella sp. 5B5]